MSEPPRLCARFFFTTGRVNPSVERYRRFSDMTDLVSSLLLQSGRHLFCTESHHALQVSTKEHGRLIFIGNTKLRKIVNLLANRSAVRGRVQV